MKITKTTSYLILTGFYFLLSIIANGQTTYHVPSDFETIQSAIEKAESGDTVLVAPGNYVENINFLGKDIYLTSEFIFTNDKTTIEETVIDGSQPSHPDTGSVVRIVGGESSKAVLSGFTITRGTGTRTYNTAEGLYFRTGGGINVDHSSPTIVNNIIQYNKCTPDASVSGAGGGGLRVGFGTPYIARNVITRNSGGYAGGIMIAFCKGMLLQNNLISYNHSDGDFGGGGGVYVDWENINILNNTIVNNSSDGTGGGFCITGNTSSIKNCIIYGNTASTQSTASIRKRQGGNPKVIYTNIEGGWNGDGNKNRNPKFSDQILFQLDPSSPCVDAGDPDRKSNDQFHPETEKVYPPAKGKKRCDMGAYGGRKYQITESSTIVGVNDILPIAQFELTNKGEDIFLKQNKRGYLYLRAFNKAGQLVETLNEGILETGIHQFNLSRSGFQLIQAIDGMGSVQTIKIYN